ncbi:YmfL family putative regulatory protein [Rahnella sp. NRRL B-41462]|uniref:YmfL family putative regulatory protein n=1 Tax=Rahnella sp. NRRL B-41462 TaxID=1610579 RepID=UPI000DD4AD34|nr:YmfL family putative regulatory protein [Rahnella sp. NRRL B-41462]
MVDLKSTVKAMCKAFPGGRSAMAGALGMTETQFNNNLYEKNGCRFFEVAELEAMEDISGTSCLAEHFAQRRGGLFVDIPQLEELDQVELFSKSMRTAAHRGHVDMIIQAALEDGFIDAEEAKEIMKYHSRHLSARDAEVRAVLALFSKKAKAGKVDASGVQSRGVGRINKSCGVINA